MYKMTVKIRNQSLDLPLGPLLPLLVSRDGDTTGTGTDGIVVICRSDGGGVP